MDIPQLPCQQDTEKQKYGYADPQTQRPRHVLRFGTLGASATEHEIQGGCETAENRHKGECYEVRHVRNYYVNHRLRWLWIAITACFAVTITLSLGFWQLRRAAQKEALAQQMSDGINRQPLTGTALVEGNVAEALLHQAVRLRGEWLAAQTVYLDNRQMSAKVGFYVMTPLRLEGSGMVVMVQRGWAPRNFVERESLPEVQTPKGIVQLDGRIALPPSKLYEPGSAAVGPIRQNLDLQSFKQESGIALRTDFTVVETSPASEGLRRDWPVVNLGVEKHYGYAVQWFALAALFAGLFVWFQLRPLIVSSKDSSTHV